MKMQLVVSLALLGISIGGTQIVSAEENRRVVNQLAMLATACPESEQWERLVEYAQYERGIPMKTRSIGKVLEIWISSSGNGRYGISEHTVWRVNRNSCRGVAVTLRHTNGELSGSIQFNSEGDFPPTQKERRALLKAAKLKLARPNSKSSAAAKMALSGGLCTQFDDSSQIPSQDNRWTLSPPIFDTQPTHPGKPSGISVLTYWPQGEAKESAPDKGERYVLPIGPPALVHTQGEFKLFRDNRKSRRGGGLIAVYNQKSNRHRWVMASPDSNECIEGEIQVLGGLDNIVVLKVGEDSIFVIDLGRGGVHRLRAKGISMDEATYDSDSNAIVLNDLPIPLKTINTALIKAHKRKLSDRRSPGQQPVSRQQAILYQPE